MVLALAALLMLAAPASAAPSFPTLSGRVVDEAQILSPATEQRLDGELARLESDTGRQMVVATVPDLQGYEIEEYGYQLGRAWAIGRKGEDDGVILLVAPTERRVRIEVGYGLEPILTDALSSVILQTAVLPRFREGQMEAGVVAGAEAVIQQLSLPADEASARVAQAAQTRQSSDGGISAPVIFIIFIVFWILSGLMGGRGRRGRRGGLWWLLPLILSSGGGGGGRGGGGFGGGGFGGGGFGGGGGSFGGGGSSGRW